MRVSYYEGVDSYSNNPIYPVITIKSPKEVFKELKNDMENYREK
jgi:hypothetical protein